jgi:hypothetical protein
VKGPGFSLTNTSADGSPPFTQPSVVAAPNPMQNLVVKGKPQLKNLFELPFDKFQATFGEKRNSAFTMNNPVS